MGRITSIAFPFLVVNSEKYIFSPNVLKTGEQLYSAFVKLKDTIQDNYYRYLQQLIG